MCVVQAQVDTAKDVLQEAKVEIYQGDPSGFVAMIRDKLESKETSVMDKSRYKIDYEPIEVANVAEATSDACL